MKMTSRINGQRLVIMEAREQGLYRIDRRRSHLENHSQDQIFVTAESNQMCFGDKSLRERNDVLRIGGGKE